MIVEYHRANGGWVTAEDMAGYKVRFELPVRTRFGDIDLYASGPWCQGPVLPQALNIVSAFDLRALGHNSPQYIHLLTEALKLAFADRHRYYGDPRFVDVPIDTLMSMAYATERRKSIDPQKAAPGMPEAGAIAAGAPTATPPHAARDEVPPPVDTSYVCVVDREGNAFSATPSDTSSSTPVIPGTGLCPSSRGTQSWCDPRLPAALAPGKRPRLTPSPAIALRNGKVYMPFGTPGN